MNDKRMQKAKSALNLKVSKNTQSTQENNSPVRELNLCATANQQGNHRLALQHAELAINTLEKQV